LQIANLELELTQGDIAAQNDVEAVVNAANAELKIGGGVAGALHRKAGPELEKACRPLAPISPGEAVLTKAFKLPNQYVIHTLGPVYGRDKPEAELLEKCYQNSLELAEKNNIKSIAFPAISTGAFGYPIKKAAKKLPESIALVYSIQYMPLAKKIKKELEENYNKKTTLFQQVLGCSNIKPDLTKDTQAVLLVGSGVFHALELYYNSKIPVYILGEDNFKEITKEDMDSFKKNKKASYMNFLNSDQVGIIITTKPGQKRFSRALEIKEKIENKFDKKAYLFISDEIDSPEFENFPEIKSWVNTACPRLDLISNKIINAGDMDLS